MALSSTSNFKILIYYQNLKNTPKTLNIFKTKDYSNPFLYYNMFSRRNYRFFKPSKISQDFICTICQDVLYDAKKLPCDHILCDDCINKWFQKKKTCPICRKTFRLSQVNPANDIIIEIKELYVVCKFPHSDWNGPLKELDNHESNCTFSPEKCKKEILDKLPVYEKSGDEDLDTPCVSLATMLFRNHKALMENIIMNGEIGKEDKVSTHKKKNAWRRAFHSIGQKKIENFFAKK